MKQRSKSSWKGFVHCVLVWGAVIFAPLASADEFRIESRQGVIEATDFPTNQIVIGGVRYNVALDANVEIAGTFGAFTLLQPGMKVSILIRRYLDTGDREIIELKQLSASTPIEEY